MLHEKFDRSPISPVILLMDQGVLAIRSRCKAMIHIGIHLYADYWSSAGARCPGLKILRETWGDHTIFLGQADIQRNRDICTVLGFNETLS